MLKPPVARRIPPTTTAATARAAQVVQEGSWPCFWMRTSSGAAGAVGSSSVRCLLVSMLMSVRPRELAAPVDDVPGQRVDRQRDQEQHQAGRDQRVDVDAGGLRELERDVGRGGERVAAAVLAPVAGVLGELALEAISKKAAK